MLYVNFAMAHYPNDSEATKLMSVIFAPMGVTLLTKRRPTLSYQRLKTEQPLSVPELQEKIRKTVANKHDLQVFEALLTFNQSVFKLPP